MVWGAPAEWMRPAGDGCARSVSGAATGGLFGDWMRRVGDPWFVRFGWLRVVALDPPKGLVAGGRAAWREAVRELGEADAARFRGAVVRYARAVDVAERARLEWERLGRPIMLTQANKAQGQHPIMLAMLNADRQAAGFGDVLGLSPLAAKRIGPQRGRGRLVGANSSPDRVAMPPPLLRLAAVDRRRGHPVED